MTLDPALEDTRPYLFALLGIVEGEDPLAQMDASIRKRRTLDAIKRILLRESLNQPLIVMFEDLHWIDEQTQEFLNLLADSIANAKILLLVNYRPQYSHQWGSKTYYTQLRLDPLGAESADEMLAALLGDGTELASLKRLIIEKTEGNQASRNSVYDPERHRSLALLYGGADAGVYCLSFAAMALGGLGYPDTALERGNQAISLAQRLSHPYSLAFAGNFVGPLCQLRREARAAQEHAEGVIALSTEHGYPDRSAYAVQVRGWALAEQGSDEGITQIRESLAAHRAMETKLGRPYSLSTLADACIQSGRIDDGLGALTEAFAAADEQEDHSWQAEMHRLKGELLLRQDALKASEAQRCFKRAVEISRNQSAKSWELRATTSLARLLRDTDRRDEARAMLAEIYGWFTEGFETADLKDAKAMLDELTA